MRFIIFMYIIDNCRYKFYSGVSFIIYIYVYWVIVYVYDVYWMIYVSIF